MAYQIDYFFNFKTKRFGVTGNLKAFRPESMVVHGFGMSSAHKYFNRTMTDYEKQYWGNMHRGTIFFYDDLSLLEQDERQFGVPEEIISEIIKESNQILKRYSGYKK